MNTLLRINCNKKHCSSCVFHPKEENRIHISAERKQEIQNYLYNLESSHICHKTNKTCYGGLEVQAKSMFDKGIISEPKVEVFLDEAAKLLFR